MKKGYVYILANKHNTVLYIGVTSSLIKRIYEHKNKFVDGFSKKYNLDKLVYFEHHESIVRRHDYCPTKKWRGTLILPHL